MLLSVLAFVLILVNTKGLNASFTSFTSPKQIKYQIDAAIKFMCMSQYESNGQFLYKAYFKKDKIEINGKENNMPRQAGALYAIGMYYRLYHDNLDNIGYSIDITQCIHNSLKYLKSMSIPIEFGDGGQLIDGNTGCTALGIMAMIEICTVDSNICTKYSDEFVLWLQGLITMRNHKLETDLNILKHGAFAKKLKKPSESSSFYDAEGYVAFARMLKFRKNLYLIINQHDKLWNIIINIVDGLDEYFIFNQHEANPHWFIQAWFDRFITLNQQYQNGVVNNFQNYYIVSILMKESLEEQYKSIEGKKNYKLQSKCYLIEATIDMLYAINVIINDAKYDKSDSIESLELFQKYLWNIVEQKYNIITKKQLFKDKLDGFEFYFESKFDGVILTDDIKGDFIQIDHTQHCVSALMKINSLLYDTEETMSYYTNVDELSNGKIQNGVLRVFIECLIMLILFVFIGAFYCCYIYPKKKQHQTV